MKLCVICEDLVRDPQHSVPHPDPEFSSRSLILCCKCAAADADARQNLRQFLESKYHLSHAGNLPRLSIDNAENIFTGPGET